MLEKRELEQHNNLVLVFALLIVSLLFLYFTPTLLQQRADQNAITGFATSQVGNLSAGVATFISCTWSASALAVSFGTSLNPNTTDINATQNYGGARSDTFYNVTVSTLSNVQVNITMKGEDFISGANKIAISNVTWISNTTDDNSTVMAPANSIALTSAFNTTNPMAASEAIGSTVWYRFWLDVPGGAVAGTYLGNYTQQCTSAT